MIELKEELIKAINNSYEANFEEYSPELLELFKNLKELREEHSGTHHWVNIWNYEKSKREFIISQEKLSIRICDVLYSSDILAIHVSILKELKREVEKLKQLESKLLKFARILESSYNSGCCKIVNGITRFDTDMC